MAVDSRTRTNLRQLLRCNCAETQKRSNKPTRLIEVATKDDLMVELIKIMTRIRVSLVQTLNLSSTCPVYIGPEPRRLGSALIQDA